MATARLQIEGLLAAYAAALSEAVSENGELADRSSNARSLFFRWQGGESLDALRDALFAEKCVHEALPPRGESAERIGSVFGDLCRACSVPTEPLGTARL